MPAPRVKSVAFHGSVALDNDIPQLLRWYGQKVDIAVSINATANKAGKTGRWRIAIPDGQIAQAHLISRGQDLEYMVICHRATAINDGCDYTCALDREVATDVEVTPQGIVVESHSG